MQHRNLRTGAKLRVEPLEKRLMLDGNVVAKVVAGNLWVTGDIKDNAIQIDVAATLTPGQYAVTIVGQGTGPTASPTLINKQLVVATPFIVKGDIIVNLGCGNDTLGVGLNAAPTETLPRNLIVGMGFGNDLCQIANMQAPNGDFRVDMGPGNDRLELINSTSAGSAILCLGLGNDVAILGTVTLGNRLWLDAGCGNDQVDIGIEPQAPIPVGNGVVIIPPPILFFPGVNARYADILLGFGDDSLTIINSTITVSTNLDGGPGTDRINKDFDDPNAAFPNHFTGLKYRCFELFV